MRSEETDNVVDGTALIGPNVKLGKGNYIGPYCVIRGKVEIGDNNYFAAYVSVGLPPQHRKVPLNFKKLDDLGTIRIGSNNAFREFVTVHQPYISETRVGSQCYIMAYAHISHDTLVEDGVTIANSVQIGGHSVLMKDCNIGLSAVLHQFSVVGSYAMLGMGSITAKPVIPFNKYVGSSPKRISINKVGLERYGFSAEEMQHLEEWSKQYLVSGQGVLQIERLRAEVERFEAFVEERNH
jgi:UDP-N-acetylglucosamine acyltransferase